MDDVLGCSDWRASGPAHVTDFNSWFSLNLPMRGGSLHFRRTSRWVAGQAVSVSCHNSCNARSRPRPSPPARWNSFGAVTRFANRWRPIIKGAAAAVGRSEGVGQGSRNAWSERPGFVRSCASVAWNGSRALLTIFLPSATKKSCNSSRSNNSVTVAPPCGRVAGEFM